MHSLVLRVARLQLGVSGGHGDARLETADHREVVGIIVTVRIELKGNIEIRRLLDCDIEMWTHHANDFVDLAAQRDPFPDHLGIAAEAPLPESIGQHRGLRRLRQVLFVRIAAAAHHVCPEEAKEIGAGTRHLNLLGRTFADQIRHVESERRNVLCNLGLLPPEIEFIGRSPAAAAPFENVLKHHHPVRVGIRSRFQQDGVHNRENRRVGADSQRQRRDDHEGESWTLQEHTDGVLKVLQKRIHGVLRRKAYHKLFTELRPVSGRVVPLDKFHRSRARFGTNAKTRTRFT